MSNTKSARFIAIFECIVFTIIAGSTLVFGKLVLDIIGPLTLTGLRYFLAFLILFPFMVHHDQVKHFSPAVWFRFFLIGLSFYAIGNGALYWGLEYIPATTASLVLNLIPLIVLLVGIVWLKEIPTSLQVAGLLIVVSGGVLFFLPGLKVGEPLGIALVAIGLVGNVIFGILGREIARDGKIDALDLTAVPLALGSMILIPVAFSLEGLPRFSVMVWSIVLVLTVINTVGAYMLYNHALRVLSAFELSTILNLTPLMTAVWAWFFLGERLGLVQIVGMILVVFGILAVQLGR